MESNHHLQVRSLESYPLNERPINTKMVDRERIELSISGCKPDVFPLALTALNLVLHRGYDPLWPP